MIGLPNVKYVKVVMAPIMTDAYNAMIQTVLNVTGIISTVMYVNQATVNLQGTVDNVALKIFKLNEMISHQTLTHLNTKRLVAYLYINEK